MDEVNQLSLRYLMARGAEAQWRDFLRAMAAELSIQLSPAELRRTFHNMGRRMAQASPLDALTLPSFEQRANDWLLERGWGWLRIDDGDEWLDLMHACGPLRAAFGDDAMRWTSALFEGLYAGWLRQAGAGEDLEVRQIGGASGTCDVLQFRFAHSKVLA